jgi:ferredoxin
MTMADSEDKKPPEAAHRRDNADAPSALPGIRRFQFFSDLSDRPLTRNLNRAAMLGIAGAMGALAVKPLVNDVPETLYCYECRACYATQDRCPVGIAQQAELTVSSRVADYERFLAAGGLKCLRCGNCVSFCVVNLNLPAIFGRMQALTMAAIRRGKVPRAAVEAAFTGGLVNRLYVDDVARWLGKA